MLCKPKFEGHVCCGHQRAHGETDFAIWGCSGLSGFGAFRGGAPKVSRTNPAGPERPDRRWQSWGVDESSSADVVRIQLTSDASRGVRAWRLSRRDERRWRSTCRATGRLQPRHLQPRKAVVARLALRTKSVVFNGGLTDPPVCEPNAPLGNKPA